MNALELIHRTRSLGFDFLVTGNQLQARNRWAMAIAMPEELRRALIAQRSEILAILRAEREAAKATRH